MRAYAYAYRPLHIRKAVAEEKSGRVYKRRLGFRLGFSGFSPVFVSSQDAGFVHDLQQGRHRPLVLPEHVADFHTERKCADKKRHFAGERNVERFIGTFRGRQGR